MGARKGLPYNVDAVPLRATRTDLYEVTVKGRCINGRQMPAVAVIQVVDEPYAGDCGVGVGCGVGAGFLRLSFSATVCTTT